MMPVTSSEKKKARLKFFGLYALTLVLLFIVITAFWGKKDNELSVVPAFDEARNFIQLDTILHHQVELLDEKYLAYIKGSRTAGTSEADELVVVKNELISTLDSVEATAATLKDGPVREARMQITSRFRTACRLRENLFAQLAITPKGKMNTANGDSQPGGTADNSTANGGQLKVLLARREQKIMELESSLQSVMALKQSGTNDVQILKEITDKDKTIAALQYQLKQKEAQGSIGDNSEWKQKYSSLKSSFDKTAANEEALKNAYKTVVDDNKRLVVQLQAIRKKS